LLIAYFTPGVRPKTVNQNKHKQFTPRGRELRSLFSVLAYNQNLKFWTISGVRTKS